MFDLNGLNQETSAEFDVFHLVRRVKGERTEDVYGGGMYIDDCNNLLKRSL